ncbi:hypothetical protein BAQU_2015, partial [Bifidobacterium aquikefiri]
RLKTAVRGHRLLRINGLAMPCGFIYVKTHRDIPRAAEHAVVIRIVSFVHLGDVISAIRRQQLLDQNRVIGIEVWVFGLCWCTGV